MIVRRTVTLSIALALLNLFLLADGVLAQAASQPQTVDLGEYQVEFDETFPVDLDEDGVTDLILYYMDDVLVASAEDTNQDGQPDFWLRYTPDWYADMEVRDQDFDGEPDEFVSMDENGRVLNVGESGSDSGTGSALIYAGIAAGILLFGAGAAMIVRSRRKASVEAANAGEVRPFCGNCGTENNPGSAFCKRCGGKLGR